ncbi:MAG: hypothetical protein ACD_5C00246G0002 [uncultured bacterium]|nr:MAG: hypothetical protein ACD_5C00246G0002 [uncultured bacterium]
MKNIKLPKEVTAYVFLIMATLSFFPIVLFKIFSFNERIKEIIVISWNFIYIFIILQLGLPFIISISIKIHRENERRNNFPNTDELNEDVDPILKKGEEKNARR